MDEGFEIWELCLHDTERQFAWRIQYIQEHNGPDIIGRVELAYFNRYNPSKENRVFQQAFNQDHFKITKMPFEFRAGKNVISEELSQGRLSTFEETVRWKLDWFHDPEAGISPWPYKSWYRWKYPPLKIVVPQPRLRINGKISVGALDFELNEVSGHQTHLWGTRYPKEILRLHCTAFEETDYAVLNAITMTTRLGLVPLPAFTAIQLELYGEMFFFNTTSSLLRNASRFEENRWLLAAENKTKRLQIEVQFDENAMAPFGPNTQFTGIASVQVWQSEKSGGEWRQLKKLTCRDAADLEIHRTSTGNSLSPE